MAEARRARSSGGGHRRGGPAAARRSDESPIEKRGRARKILTRLHAAYPGASIELRYRTPLELLVATILSAQCTDERVNMVTEDLFKRYRRAEDWARADLPTLEREIHSTGFYKAKARALVAMARGILEHHGGQVPKTLEALTALSGVGRKTANVVLGNAFGIPALAVDTHVTRVSQRLGLTAATDPETIHDELCALLPRNGWTQATHLLIIHGRRTCHARRPECWRCAVRGLCAWPEKSLSAPAPAEPFPRGRSTAGYRVAERGDAEGRRSRFSRANRLTRGGRKP
jgi:endonuclease-3